MLLIPPFTEREDSRPRAWRGKGGHSDRPFFFLGGASQLMLYPVVS